MGMASSADTARQAAQPGIVQTIADSVVEKIMSHAGTRVVFGEPVREEGLTVIPVAHVTYCFGFGGGSGPSGSAENPDPGGGGGGGGNVSARPVGFIATTTTGTRFVPVTDWSQIVRTVATVLGIVSAIVAWSLRSHRSSAK